MGRFLEMFGAGLLCLALTILVSAPSTAGNRVYGMAGEVAMGGSPARINFRIPNAGAAGTTEVQQTGASPATLTIKKSAFQGAGGQTRIFPPVPRLAQLVTDDTYTNNPAILRPGGGPAANGTVGFCGWIAGDPNATGAGPNGGNPANPNCATPGQATQPGMPGAIIRAVPIAGKSQFGGTFEMLGNQTGGRSSVLGTTPTFGLVSHAHTAANSTPSIFPAGGGAGGGTVSSPLAGPRIAPASAKVTAGAVVFTAPPSFVGAIQTAGATVNTLPPGAPSQQIGLAVTTGQIFAQKTSGMGATFTVTGSDARTPSGSGMITLVAGALRNDPSSGSTFTQFTSVTMNLPEPGATTGLAAGLFCLVALARVRARRR